MNKIIFSLLMMFTAQSWAVNYHYKVLSDGSGSPIMPHAVLYSTYTQAIVATNAVQYIELNSHYHKYGFTQISRSTWSVDTAGLYEFCFSGIADITAIPAAKLEVWLRVNGVDIPESNTIVNVITAACEMTVAVCLVNTMNAGDNFAIMTYGSDTDLQWLYTAAGAVPSRPVTPSVILSSKKISGLE